MPAEKENATLSRDGLPPLAALPPFALEPVFVSRIWGSTDLRPWYDFAPAVDPVGEVWLTGDQCKVTCGELKDMTLAEVFALHSTAMLGQTPQPQAASPLLIKVIFAKEKLSVQVHPDDRLAQKYGQPRGKTECWYCLAADPGAEVAVGLLPGVTLEKVEQGVAGHSLEQSLSTLSVSSGDMIYVDAGTVHAIWPGSVLLETQQNCDLTYRLYDYGRPRELHVAKALESIRLKTDAGKVPPIPLPDRTVLVEGPYFLVEKIPVDRVRSGSSMSTHAQEDSASSEAAKANPELTYLFAAAGSGQVSPATGEGAGDTFPPIQIPTRGIVIVPASSPAWQVENLGGLDLIRITPRWPAL